MDNYMLSQGFVPFMYNSKLNVRAYSPVNSSELAITVYVNLYDNSFRLEYNIPQSRNKLTTKSHNSITDKNLFKRVMNEFKRQVEPLFNAFDLINKCDTCKYRSEVNHRCTCETSPRYRATRLEMTDKCSEWVEK